MSRKQPSTPANLHQNSNLMHNTGIGISRELEYPYGRASQENLRENTDFIQYVKDNLWENRRDRGISWRKDVFEFIEETYGRKAVEPMKDWISEGMVQGDLIGLDDMLYRAYHERMARFGAPDGFSFPSQAKANLDAITDPREKEKRLLMREFFKEHNAHYRARKRALEPK